MTTSQKILVTGGTGFIGSHTAVRLLEQGFDVLLLDNLSNSNTDVLEGIREITGKSPSFFEIDMQNAEELNHFFEHNQDIKAVIHFAALKAVGESVKRPLRYYQNNLVGLLNLLASMKKYAVSNLIFSSSATVYGIPNELPISEDHPIKPAFSPYGHTKQMCETFIRDTTTADPNLSAISLRYFNPIGAHASALIGELPLGIPNNLMPFITQTAAGIRTELSVFGGDYSTPDGTCIRDYIHVVDLAEAHARALHRLLHKHQKSNFEVFNLGTGKGYSVLEVIQSFEKMTNQKLPYRIVDRRPGDVEAMYASTSRANAELNWKAERDLDSMTSSAWAWQQRLEEQRKG